MRRKGGSGGSRGGARRARSPLIFARNRGPNGRKQFFLRPPPLPPPPLTYLKVWTRKWEALPESRQDFEVANFWTSQSWFLSSNLFFECQYPLIDKPMLIIKPTVPSTCLLGMVAKLYPSNKQHIPNQNWVSERKALLAGCSYDNSSSSKCSLRYLKIHFIHFYPNP